MGQDHKDLQIRHNKGQINIAQDNAVQHNTYHHYEGGQDDTLVKLQTAAKELIEKLQQAEPIEQLDRELTIDLIKQVVSQVETDPKPHKRISLLNQKLDTYVPLLTGVAAFNSTISAIHDFQNMINSFMG